MHKAIASQRPTLVAAGFCALDVVFGIDDPTPKFYAGGTCGNIAAGLAFLGWEAIPIARLADDVAGKFVREDLKRWGVDTNFLGLTPTSATPVVLEKIYVNKNGVPKHRFLWNCPDCSSYFPPFRPVLSNQVEELKHKLQNPDVFYVDRVSRSTVELARHFADRGSLIYFEPSATAVPQLFREMLQVCDVLKYSSQRARSFSELLRDHKAFLEIETLGEDGLRFRTRRSFNSWHTTPAYDVKIRDTAGAGDWTSVGLISELFVKGKVALEASSRQDILSSLENAQALAALNCEFEGPRGAMYQISKSRFLQGVSVLQRNKLTDNNERKISLTGQLSTSAVCPSCGPSSGSREEMVPKGRVFST